MNTLSFKKHCTTLLASACLLSSLFSCELIPDDYVPGTPVDTVPAFVTHPENLNIVYFVPTDNPEVPEYKERLSELLIYFQNYVKSEMNRNNFGNKTFGLPLDTATGKVKIITIFGEHGQETYDYGSGNAILGEIDTYKASHPEEFTSVHTLIILPLRSDGGRQPFYGWGKNCFAVDNPHINVEEIPTTQSNFIGGMLHELGHGLGLAHNKAKSSEQTTLGTSLMGSGNYTFGSDPTFITKSDCAILNRNQIFQSVSVPDIYGSANTTLSPQVSYDSVSNSIQLEGTFTSDKAVSDVLFYLDPNVNDEGTGVNHDYNSVAWRAAVTNGDSFSINLPFSEVQDHGNWPYKVKVKLLMENGRVNTHTYNFKFVNGKFTLNSLVGIYQHSNYNGWGVELAVGSYTKTELTNLGAIDNDISSIKVPLGLTVTLYADDNFAGQSYVVGSGNVSFLSSFNDKVSSLVVSDPNAAPSVGIYQHSNYNGWGVNLTVRSYTSAQLTSLGAIDNDISSIMVPAGLKITLYADDNFLGQAYELGSGNVSFLSGFNDKTSSVVVSEQ